MKRVIITALLVLSMSGCASIYKSETTSSTPNASPFIGATVHVTTEPAQLVEEQEVVVQAPEPPVEIVATVMVPEPIQTRTYSESELRCMAVAMYHEAGGEGELGMRAVGYAVINRTSSGSYPTTICGVVHQKRKIKGQWKCQFDWSCTSKANARLNTMLYERARTTAVAVLNREAANPIGKAISFHNPTVRPSWARRMTFIRRIGNHFFYA